MLGAQFHGEVAGVRFCDAGETELHARPARKTFDVRRFLEQTLDMLQDAIGLQQRCSGRRNVIENKSAFVKCRQELAAEESVNEVGNYEKSGDNHENPARVSQRKLEKALVKRDAALEETAAVLLFFNLAGILSRRRRDESLRENRREKQRQHERRQEGDRHRQRQRSKEHACDSGQKRERKKNH